MVIRFARSRLSAGDAGSGSISIKNSPIFWFGSEFIGTTDAPVLPPVLVLPLELVPLFVPVFVLVLPIVSPLILDPLCVLGFSFDIFALPPSVPHTLPLHILVIPLCVPCVHPV